jgi:hypothetical protein
MATYREIVYMVLDLLKESSDDSFYTEEHIIFLANKFRPYLLERKYRKSRNAPFSTVSDQNYQEICVNLQPQEMLPGDCGGSWLRSVEKIPETIDIADPKIMAPSDMIFCMVNWIAPERMPYIGYNKWLKKIIYASKSADGYLYLSSQNPAFQHLDQVRMQAAFSNPEEAAALACDSDGNPTNCDVLDMEFPLEEALIVSCIEMVVQEIAGPRYAPQDKNNNASDELSDANVTGRRAYTPVQAYDMAEARQPSGGSNEQ